MNMLTRHESGYTLVEIMIAITIGLVLMVAASATYIVQNRSFAAQESVSEINTQSKIALDLISGQIRSAGFGAPEDLNLEPVNGTTSVITPLDSSNSPDAITIIGGFNMIGTLWPAVASATCPDSVALGSNQVRIIYTGTEAPNMTDRRYLSIDGVEFVMVQNCNLTANGTCDSGVITLDRSLSQSFPVIDTNGDSMCDTGRPVYLVEDTTYCVDTNLSLRRIRRNANAATCTTVVSSTNEVIAQNIEDLQFAYATDADGNGQTDDINGDGSLDSADFVNADVIADPSTIRAFRINVLARADRADINFTGKGNPPAVIENRNLSPTNDDFRRRWWQALVTMRNE